MSRHLLSGFRVFRCSFSGRIQHLPDSRNISSQFHFLQHPSSFLIRFITTIPNLKQFTLDYLVNTCGLSPESALKASQRLLFKSPTTTNPDSVLSLFKSYGITQPQISKIIADNPSLLFAKPIKTLKPKLDFLNSIGILGPLLGHILAKNTHFLGRSLDKEIVPCINFLKSLAVADCDIAIILNRGWWGLHNAQHKMEPNISILQDHGVPQSSILKILVNNPGCLSTDSVKFKEGVLQLNRMSIDTSSMVFWRCLIAIIGIKKPKWDAKLEMYKSFGWSEDEVLSVFKRHPSIMLISVNKINLALDFFMNRMKWNQGDIAKNPTVMSLSLEKRIIPRCYILRILLSMGLIRKGGMAYGLLVAEDGFEKYVLKYHHEAPELLKLYKSKVLT